MKQWKIAIVLAMGLLALGGSPLAAAWGKPYLKPHHAPPYRLPSATDPVHRRELNQPAPFGTLARCRDATFSFRNHEEPTCTRHGGVQHWFP